MKPAVCAELVAGQFAVGAFFAAVAFMRLLDVPLLVSPTESAGWTVAMTVAWLYGGFVVATTGHSAEEECRRAGRKNPCEADRNADLVAFSLFLVQTVCTILVFFSMWEIIRLRDALVTIAAFLGPVATVWYWASTLSHASPMIKRSD